MASIVKRKKKFSVVYTYTDEKGVKRQRWETFNTNAEAKKRKTQVEFQQNTYKRRSKKAENTGGISAEYRDFYSPGGKNIERAFGRIYVDLWSKHMGDVYIRR